jgi:putative ABC transport system permease protein
MMSAVAHPSALTGPKDGGVAGRSAVIRWAGRMFRREWRQQLLVLALLTVAVTAAIVSITIVHHIGPADNSEFGSASSLLEFDASDPQKLEAGIAAARRHFGTIDVVAHRSVTVPGSVETVDYRAQDPNGPYGGVLVALRRGKYPTEAGDVTVTDGVAESLRLELGSTLALDGRRRTVVGIVENPRKLSDEFALVAPSALDPTHVTVMVDASNDAVESFFGPGTGPPALVGAQE